MFKRMGDAFRNFMLGRYGSDPLNKWLLIVGLVLVILGSLCGRFVPWMSHFGIAAYLPLSWCLFRMLSRNTAARRRENAAVEAFFSHMRDREHRYYRCPKCRQTVRVPRGRGKINIRCPKCSERFIRKT